MKPPPPLLARILAVIVGALVLTGAAVLNGQPFFTPDTAAYVRGPDVAVVKLLGARFASPWAAQEPEGAHLAAAAGAPSRAAHSYDDKEVLAGRSIYYGALAYLGARTGGFWLTVFVQALAVAWLAEMALWTLGRRSLRLYGALVAVLAFATSAPFFIADLMPDIWSGVAVGALALLFAAPERLGLVERVALAAMIVFAAMAHNSHVLIVAGVAACGALLWMAGRKGAPDPRPALLAGALALLAAVAGTALFSAMVKHSVGAPPITPPFLTARVSADGPGRLYVAEHCRPPRFAVCAFADRLGANDTDGFLWNEDGRTGVFAVASPDQRRALAEEQGRFALASTLAYPWMQLEASSRNVLLQLVQTDLEDFDYKPNVLASLKADLPAAPRARLLSSLAARRGWPIRPIWAEEAVVIWLSLGVMALAWGQDLRAGAGLGAPGRFALLALCGVLANTVACGVLSDLYGRYQARVIWILPLAGAVVALRWAEGRGGSPSLRRAGSSNQRQLAQARATMPIIQAVPNRGD